MTGSLAAASVPPLSWAGPFAALLLAIAVFPLVPRICHWWEHNSNKLIVAVVLSALALLHYQTRGHGTSLHNPALARVAVAAGLEVHTQHGHAVTGAGWAAMFGALGNALFEYVPFIVLLFALYCIAGGILIKGDIPAHPATNTAVLAFGAVIANVIGTTGASMLLIRPLLATNSERKHVAHTVVFFIFIVSNVGGCLLPIGDPPLFLGYLRGVPFFWTLQLWQEWAVTLGVLLLVYHVWDTRAYRRETVKDLARDEIAVAPIRLLGGLNLVWLILVVAAVAVLAPGAAVPGTDWIAPPFLREVVLMALVGLSFATTPRGLRAAGRFNFHAIAEVACLFVGVFITMQVPLEILAIRGQELGLIRPWQYFWATGFLSGFLDNAPTYAVMFQAAHAQGPPSAAALLPLADGGLIREDLLAAVSLGAVFMGASTYIGNGPNFMVRSIAQQQGVKMPSFFGYVLYAFAVLLPIFAAVTALFLGRS